MDIKKILYWTPRNQVMAFAAFLFMFSIDSFFGPEVLSEQLPGFLIHNIPTLLVLSLLWVAWRWEKVGAGIFAGLAVLFFIFFGAYRDIMQFMILVLPLLVVSTLFYLSSR